MNGFIAPLLVLMMTGMAFCQQPQPGSFGGSSSRSLDRSDELQSKFLLVMGPELLQNLREVGYLASDINPQAQREVAHIEFHGDDNNSGNSTLLERDISRLATFDQGRLVFEFNEELIRTMNLNGLSYEVPPGQFQKINEVVVIYGAPPQPATVPVNRPGRRGTEATRPTGQNRSGQREISQDMFGGQGLDQFDRQQERNRQNQLEPQEQSQPQQDQFGQQNQFGQRNQRQIQQDQLGQRTSGGTPVFPDMAGRNNSRRDGNSPNLELDRGTARNAQRKSSSPLFGPEVPDEILDQYRNGSTQTRNDGRTLSPRIDTVADRNLRNSFEDHRRTNLDDGFHRSIDRMDRLTRKDWNKNLDSSYRDERLAREGGFNSQDNSRLNSDQFRQRQIEGFSNSGRDTFQPALPSRLASENQNYKQMLSDELYKRGQMEREIDELKRANFAVEDKLRRERELNYRAPIEFPPRSLRARYRQEFDGSASAPGRDAYVGMPGDNRVAVLPHPTTRAPNLAINGPNDVSGTAGAAPIRGSESRGIDTDRVKRNNQALWFIMLCSVGLNFYLALIARGFYVRYEELADEIRDTFTSSSM